MEQNLQTNEFITRYLLGELREPELSRFEEEFFAHDDFYTLVLDKEDELIESYLRDGLSGRERTRFEKTFLRTSEGRRKVAIYKALTSPRDTTRSRHTEQPSLWQSLLALLSGHKLLMQTALLLLALLSLTYFGFDFFKRRPQVAEDARRIDHTARPAPTVQPAPAKPAEPTPAEPTPAGNRPEGNNKSAVIRATPRHVTPRTPRKSNEPSSPSTETATAPQIELSTVVTLLPSVARGAGAQNLLAITPGSATVPAKILLAANTYKRYRAVLRTQGGEVVWSRSGLKARQVNGKGVLVLQMPVSALSRKYYLLDLQGSDGGGRNERVNYYQLTVIRN
jgi:hypothetical protein